MTRLYRGKQPKKLTAEQIIALIPVQRLNCTRHVALTDFNPQPPKGLHIAAFVMESSTKAVVQYREKRA